MKVHRFIIDNFSFESVAQITDHAVVHHMRTVLRLEIGESIIVCDGLGNEARGTIDGIEKSSISVKFDQAVRVAAESQFEITLCVAIIKRDNFELVVQKAVELGATSIVPLVTQRTIKTGLNLERLRTIIREAAEQSGRGILTKISEPVDFFRALEEMSEDATGIFCDVSGVDSEDFDSSVQKNRFIFIGPEGGWSDDEIAAAEKKLQPISFGKFVMRAETAAIIATHWMVNLK